METRDLYDLFFIAIIAFVLARWFKRRQAADERRRERELAMTQAPDAVADDAAPADVVHDGQPPATEATPETIGDRPHDRPDDGPDPDGRAGRG